MKCDACGATANPIYTFADGRHSCKKCGGDSVNDAPTMWIWLDEPPHTGPSWREAEDDALNMEKGTDGVWRLPLSDNDRRTNRRGKYVRFYKSE